MDPLYNGQTFTRRRRLAVPPTAQEAEASVSRGELRNQATIEIRKPRLSWITFIVNSKTDTMTIVLIVSSRETQCVMVRPKKN